jgi:hypothetical protein
MAIITKPVTEPNDIQSELGISTTNYGTIMRPDLFGYNDRTINPASKHKPIHHPKLGMLVGDEIKGCAEDIANGIYYGLQVSSGTALLADLHNANWEYVSRPRGGIDESPFRPHDFVGYDDDAKFTLEGSGVGSEVIVDSGPPFTAQLYWNNNGNTTGVDIAEIIGNADYSNLYLCALVDGYATVMINNDAEGYGYSQFSPLDYGGDFNASRFTCPALPTALQTETTRKVTLMITDYDKASKLMGSWQLVTNSATYRGVYVTVPNLVGLSVEFKKYQSSMGYGKFILGDVSLGPNNLSISVQVSTPPTREGYYKISVNIAGTTLSTERFIAANSTMSFILSWANPLKTNGTYQWNASMYRLDAAGGNTVTSVADAKRGTIVYSGGTTN